MKLLFLLLVTTMLHATPWNITPHIADHMVIQQGKTMHLRGKTKPNTTVRLEFMQHKLTATATASGQFHLTIPASKATAEPQTMRITQGDEAITISDILIGDVWLFTGQSNMDFPLGKATGGKEALASANQPNIRILHLTGTPTDSRRYDAATLARMTPEKFFQGTWQRSDEKSAASVSAIAWWTALALQQKNATPIGIIENAIGGSGTEAWLTQDALASSEAYAPLRSDWLNAPLMSPWARGRAKQNLGTNLTVPHPFQPGFLFAAMDHHLHGIPLKGIVWYQGETNAEIPNREYNATLIKNMTIWWMKHWQQVQPFYMIELPRIGGNDPLRAHWPLYRESQRDAVKSLTKHAHFIPTTDIGYDSPDVHPPDKKPIADRLARAISL